MLEQLRMIGGIEKFKQYPILRFNGSTAYERNLNCGKIFTILYKFNVIVFTTM